AGGLTEAFASPGFVPAYHRPLFCEGIGPFRWAALSGDEADIATIDATLRSLFPDDGVLQRWLELAPGRVAFQGLPARICWLGFGDRARAGLAINELVRSGQVKAPVVIGRDHLDSGSVASPYRETEAMRDGSDAIGDWPILNALLNVAAGATWVSVHHGGGVGIGNSLHAGMVVVADGTDEMAERLERVLTTDPGTGVLRHVDAGYPEAMTVAAFARCRGSSTATRTHASVAIAWPSSTCARPARATRSCTPRAVASSRPSRRPAPRAKPGSPMPCAATGSGCAARARRRSRPSPATASTAKPSLRPCVQFARPVELPRGSAPTQCHRSSTAPTSTSISR